MFLENNIENTTAIATVLIAAIAIFIAIWQIITTRVHNKLSVVPHLVFERDVDDASMIAKIILKNVGIGPAIIKSYNVFFDEIKQKSIDENLWAKIIVKAGFKPKYVRGMKLELDSAVGVNEEKLALLIVLSKPNKMPEMLKALKRINIKINYESVYGKQRNIELNSDL